MILTTKAIEGDLDGFCKRSDIYQQARADFSFISCLWLLNDLATLFMAVTTDEATYQFISRQGSLEDRSTPHELRTLFESHQITTPPSTNNFYT